VLFWGYFVLLVLPKAVAPPFRPREKPRRIRAVLSPWNLREPGPALAARAAVQTTYSAFPLDVVFASDGSPNAHLFGDEFAQLLGSAKAESDLLRFADLLEDALVAET
jgi:hypothetical protein